MGLESGTKNYVVGSGRGWALIKYSGIYDFQELTDAFRKWWLSHYYLINDKEHSQKVSSAGTELKIDMVAFRNVTWYIRFYMQIEIEIYRHIDVLVEQDDGKKVKKQQGDMEIRMKAYIDKNYKNTFKGSGFKKFLRQIYERFIVFQHLRKMRGKLLKEAESVITEIKNVLELNKR